MSAQIVEGSVEEPTVIDAMQADAGESDDEIVMPDNAPDLKPYLRLPFRKRAKFIRLFGQLQEMQQTVEAEEKKRKRTKAQSQTTQIEQASVMYDMFALMDDLMRIAAKDEAVYSEWVEDAADEDFQQLFAAYMQRSQPGEASSSAS